MLSNITIFTRINLKDILLELELLVKKDLKNQPKGFVFSLKEEILRTTSIGKKLITASRTNSHLKESYEELGREFEKILEEGEYEIILNRETKIRSLLQNIKACKKDLKDLEEEVVKIRFSAGPIDISKNTSNQKKE